MATDGITSMIRVSTISAAVLVIASLMVTPSAEGAQRWPIDGAIDLSSTFGEIRERHFHGGIDIRTGGKVGTIVLSPADGYVWRVKMSYYGSGKCLYIMGDDGHIYVFGHLSVLAGRIDHAVKAAQVTARRYYLDVYYPPDSIRISKGEFLAHSGQTGATAPHLHFEVRSAANVPVNPLTHGFDLPDNVRPFFRRLGFQMTDDRSLFLNGRRRMFLDVVRQKKTGCFTIDTLLYFNRPFGILVDGYDLIRVGGMRQAIYDLTVYVDGKLFYESRYDSLDFETTDAVLLEYAYLEAVDGRKRVRRLFKSPGNRFAGSRGSDRRRGVFGRGGTEKVGLHQVRIVAEDCSGNRAELSFRFLWCPRENVYELDSLVTRPADTSLFFFTPIAGYEKFRIDSVLALLNVHGRWGPPPTVHVRQLKKGRLKCVAVGGGVEVAVLRLFLVTEGGALIRDLLFNGIQESQPDRCELSYEVIDNGLLITVKSPNKRGSHSRIELYSGDSLLGIEYPQYFEMNRHLCFIPPRPNYGRIDRVGAAMTRDTTRPVRIFLDSLNIFAVGYETEQEIRLDSSFTLHCDRSNFYEPRFIELHSNWAYMWTTLGLNSAHYRILPEAFACRKEFTLALRTADLRSREFPSGICWLDKEKNRWVWLDDNLHGDTLKAASLGGGSFAALFDLDPPEIRHLNIRDSRTYSDPRPLISFLAVDTLSGIDDDQDFLIKLDGKWMIPEYDPNTRRCVTRPLESLSPGKHHLGIMVYDRAGNLTEQYLNFYVKGTEESKSRK